MDIAITKTKCRGQALPIGLALLLFSSILAIALFNTGQVTSEKMRLNNTADAAAYSGLVWQARTLNFQAYTNRAMVANQVAIAQVVSMVSWSKYAKVMAGNIDKVIGWFPPAKPYTQVIKTTADTSYATASSIAAFAMPVMNSLLGILSTSQTVVYGVTAGTTQDIVREVVKRNDPDYKLTGLSETWLVENSSRWLNFSKRYSDDEGLLRKAGIINQSKDPFTSNRSWDQSLLDLALFKVKLVKAGETRLVHETSSDDDGYGSSTEWEWKGKDTMSIHIKYWKCSWKGCGWKRKELPVGWGSAYASSSSDDVTACGDDDDGGFFSFFGSGCDTWSQNRWAEMLSESEKDDISYGYQGVQPYYEIRDLKQENKDPRLPLAIEVAAADNVVRSSSKVDGIGSPGEAKSSRNGIERGMFRVDDNFANEQMSAVSLGEVYFKRPVERADKRKEYGNLFNPYWDVRLADPEARRALAWATKGIVPLSSAAGGAIPTGAGQ